LVRGEDRRGRHEELVAARVAFRDERRADVAAGARPVLDDHRNAERL
jgi:hypothetical protein